MRGCLSFILKYIFFSIFKHIWNNFRKKCTRFKFSFLGSFDILISLYEWYEKSREFKFLVFEVFSHHWCKYSQKDNHRRSAAAFSKNVSFFDANTFLFFHLCNNNIILTMFNQKEKKKKFGRKIKKTLAKMEC